MGLLFFGGAWLVRGASDLAIRIGVSPLSVGLTVVAFGTSAPELVVSVNAALSGASDISVGNVVGSNISNIGLILGLAALLRPIAVDPKVVRVDGPFMIVASLALLGVLANARVSRLEGAVLLTGLAAYVAFTYLDSRRQPESTQVQLVSKVPPASAGIPASFVRIGGGLGSLVLGGHLLVSSAVTLATLLGLSQAAIGLTIVAVGTSLPELSTSLVAAARGQGDIAVGNVLGSNIFNVLGILGVTATVSPPSPDAIQQLDLLSVVAFSSILAVLLFTRLRLERHEGLILLAAYFLYTGWVIMS